MNLKGRVYPPAPFSAVALAPPPPDDTAALRYELRLVRAELATAQHYVESLRRLAKCAINKLVERGDISDGEWYELYKLAMPGCGDAAASSETEKQVKGDGDLGAGE